VRTQRVVLSCCDLSRDCHFSELSRPTLCGAGHKNRFAFGHENQLKDSNAGQRCPAIALLVFETLILGLLVQSWVMFGAKF